MVPVVSPMTAYTLSIALASLVAMGVGAVVFLPRFRPIAFVTGLVRTDWKYPGVAWVVTAGVNALAGVIVISTFYLGIHWLTDTAFAVVLVGVAYWVSRQIDPDAVLPVPVVGRLRPPSRSQKRDAE